MEPVAIIYAGALIAAVVGLVAYRFLNRKDGRKNG